MTRASSIGLVAIALGGSGCNAILGLDQTHQQDAQEFEAGIDGLDGQQNQFGTISVMVSDLDAARAIVNDVVSAPANVPVKVGLLSTLEVSDPVKYQNGQIEVPVTFGGTSRPWRLLATFPAPSGGTIVHEYQWKIGGLDVPATFHITAPPVWGHPTGTAPGPSAAYAITVPGTAPVLSWPEIVTGGVWFDEREGGAKNNTRSYSLAWSSALSSNAAEPLVGANAAPMAAKGDWELLLDRTAQPDASCYKATGGGFLDTDLANTNTPVTIASWLTDQKPTQPALAVSGNVPQRFINVHTFGSHTARGYAPKNQIPGFARRHREGRDLQQPEYTTDWPVMLTLLSCNDLQVNQIALLDLGGEFLAPMEPVNYVEMVDHRAVDGISIETAVQTFHNGPTLDLAAPLARDVSFDGTNIGSNEVQADFVAANAIHVGGPRYMTLAWTAETGLASAAHAWEVTLYKVGVTMVPLRVWHVTDPSVMIDSAALGTVTATAANNHFIFAIRSYIGMPNAKDGDYSVRTLPFSMATFYTTGFVLAP